VHSELHGNGLLAPLIYMAMRRTGRTNRRRKIDVLASLIPLRKEKRGRGRPFSLSDEELGARRDSIHHALSVSWAAIGWKLQTARHIKHVRAALKPAESNQWVARFLVCAQFPSEPSRSLVYDAKVKRAEILNRVYALQEKLRREEELLQKFRSARAQADKRQAKRLKRPYEAQRRRTRRLARLYSRCSQEEAKLTKEICALESHLGCAEILRFIRERRYSFTPSNLANAMAGLPEIGWRRSFARCSKMKKLMGGHFSFEIFVIIRRLLKRCHATRYKLVTCFRRNIPKIPMSDYVRSHLCNNWHFLKSALEEVDIRRTHPGERPFVVCDTYMRKCSGPRHAIDEVMLEREKIVI
jgi:hypothetical protein